MGIVFDTHLSFHSQVPKSYNRENYFFKDLGFLIA